MVFNHDSYRSYLRDLLSERIGRNPAYSLRSMAAQLGLAASSLSEIIKGRANLSRERAFTVTQKLSLSAAESEYFDLLVQLETVKKPEMREMIVARMKALNPQQSVHDVSVEYFKVMSEWYHGPVMILAQTLPAPVSAARIAKKVGLSPVQVEAALERLKKLELLVEGEPGHYSEPAERVRVSSEVPNEALRAYHRQMLARAQDALTTQSPQEKCVATETFAFHAEFLGEAKKLTDEYLDRMVALGQRQPAAQKRKSAEPDVYHAGVQFFRLTTLNKESPQ